MESVDNQDTKKQQEEEVYDLGNFSDYDENGDDEPCASIPSQKPNKVPTKTETCSKEGGDKTCATGTCKTDSAEAQPVIDADKLCRKCKAVKGTLRYRGDTVCKTCYLSALEHRFKSSLRLQVKLNKKDDEFICALSGGQNSLALCRMVSEAIYNPGPRKMFFRATAVHINEAALFGVSEQEEQENVNRIKQFAELYKLETTIINIEDIYSIKNDKLQSQINSSYKIEAKEDSTEELTKEQKREKIRNLLKNSSDFGSAKDDMIAVFRKILMADHATRKNVDKIVFAETAQKVAINSLALLCKGRGADLFEQVSAEEKTFADVKIFRPMNDFLTKEVLLYDHFNKLDQFFVMYPHLEDLIPANTRYPGNGSINTLLGGFVDKLQAGFPSTVHTVLNTLNKIKPKFNEEKICPICWGKKDKLGNILEKGSIIQYLKPVDKTEAPAEVKADGNKFIDMAYESKKIKEDYLNSEYFKSKNSFEKVACFSCGRIFENAKNEDEFSNSLPGFIKLSAGNVQDKVMPKTIDEKAFDYYFYDYDKEI